MESPIHQMFLSKSREWATTSTHTFRRGGYIISLSGWGRLASQVADANMVDRTLMNKD